MLFLFSPLPVPSASRVTTKLNLKLTEIEVATCSLPRRTRRLVSSLPDRDEPLPDRDTQHIARLSYLFVTPVSDLRTLEFQDRRPKVLDHAYAV
jgi:hypothetical protein